MKHERIIWIVALLLVAGTGFYSGNVAGQRSGVQMRAQASQGFFAQRSNGNQLGAPGAVAQSQPFNGGAAAGAAGQSAAGAGSARGSVSGTVQEVAGNTFVVTTRNGSKATVTLADGGNVQKAVEGYLSDITAGTQITAFGSESNGVFQATSIQVGTTPGRTGGGGDTTTQATATP